MPRHYARRVRRGVPNFGVRFRRPGQGRTPTVEPKRLGDGQQKEITSFFEGNGGTPQMKKQAEITAEEQLQASQEKSEEVAKYIQPPYKVEKVEHGTIMYSSPYHEGLVATEDIDPKQIQRVLDDYTDAIKLTQGILRSSPHMRRYYGLVLKEIERDRNFTKPDSNIIVNIDAERFFGAGSSSIGSRGFKIFWYTPEETRRYLEKGGAFMIEATPPAAVAHEMEHTLGSDKEIVDPLGQTVAISFYLTHPEYIPDEDLERRLGLDIYLIAKHYLEKKRTGIAKEQMKAIYSVAPSKTKQYLSRYLSEDDMQRILQDISRVGYD